jgi:hypothetical protein
MIRPPKEELDKFFAYYSKDNECSAYLRLLQSKWRDRNKYPMGILGNYLKDEFAITSKANFLTDNIRNLATMEVTNAKENGAIISEPRIWNNLLSSQPLCFNLFGEMHYDLNLATEFFKSLFPTRIDKVTSVKFEYSAGRGNKNYTGDHSALDVFIEYTKDSKKGFIGIEVKYSESLSEETKETAERNFNRHESEYLRLTSDDIFIPGSVKYLKQVPISQIWRDHLLAIAHLKDYDTGFFVFLFPKVNIRCQNGVDEYQKYLNTVDEEKSGFYPRYLDDFILSLRKIHNKEWTRELEERYLGVKEII